mgnify:CR=1 FL=1
MYRTYIKRIIEIEAPGDTPEAILKAAMGNKYAEKIVSDTFMVEDEKELIIAKQKVIYDGVGKVLRVDHILK